MQTPSAVKPRQNAATALADTELKMDAKEKLRWRRDRKSQKRNWGQRARVLIADLPARSYVVGTDYSVPGLLSTLLCPAGGLHNMANWVVTPQPRMQKTTRLTPGTRALCLVSILLGSMILLRMCTHAMDLQCQCTIVFHSNGMSVFSQPSLVSLTGNRDPCARCYPGVTIQ